MVVSTGNIVRIEFRLIDEWDLVIDQAPSLPYVHGLGQLPAGLERCLEGLVSGDAFDVTLEPEETYGRRDPELVVEVGAKRLPAGDDIVVSSLLTQEAKGKMVLLRVAATSTKTTRLDGNHLLADRRLRFHGRVGTIRPASEDELAFAAHRGGMLLSGAQLLAYLASKPSFTDAAVLPPTPLTLALTRPRWAKRT